MTTALSKAEANALQVSYEVLGTRVELDIDFVKKYLVRGKAELTTNQELVMFMNTCKMQGLNPLVNGEVYLIKYQESEPAQMVVGKGAYLRRAFDHPDYSHKKDGITVKRGNEIVQKEGCCVYPGEELVGGWCRVFYTRKGQQQEAFKEVSFTEYNKGMANWKSKPATMINKVAVSQCVREAFPKDYEGVYSEEEMIASGAIPVDYEDLTPGTDGADPIIVDEPITQSERQAMFAFAQSNFGKEEGNALVKAFIEEEGMTSTTGMLKSVYTRIMEKLHLELEKTAPQPETETTEEE